MFSDHQLGKMIPTYIYEYTIIFPECSNTLKQIKIMITEIKVTFKMIHFHQKRLPFIKHMFLTIFHHMEVSRIFLDYSLGICL